jgi:hypothetical protein
MAGGFGIFSENNNVTSIIVGVSLFRMYHETIYGVVAGVLPLPI